MVGQDARTDGEGLRSGRLSEGLVGLGRRNAGNLQAAQWGHLQGSSGPDSRANVYPSWCQRSDDRTGACAPSAGLHSPYFVSIMLLISCKTGNVILSFVRLHVFDEGKHNIHLKYAEDFNRLVSDFIKK